MASAGVGSTNHVAGELFSSMTGARMLHVPYRGMYMPDLLAGRVQVAFATVAQCIEYIKDGRLRALAVTTSGE
jgi:tripartite-type tricarboxylate transporter receptor subunit TctC